MEHLRALEKPHMVLKLDFIFRDALEHLSGDWVHSTGGYNLPGSLIWSTVAEDGTQTSVMIHRAPFKVIGTINRYF